MSAEPSLNENENENRSSSTGPPSLEMDVILEQARVLGVDLEEIVEDPSAAIPSKRPLCMNFHFHGINDVLLLPQSAGFLVVVHATVVAVP